MIIAISDDRMVTVLENEAAAKIAFEAIDVEEKSVIFYAEDGSWLKPNFTRATKRRIFGLILEQGEFELLRGFERPEGVDTLEVAVGLAHGVEPNRFFNSISDIRSYAAQLRPGSIEAVAEKANLEAIRSELLGHQPEPDRGTNGPSRA